VFLFSQETVNKLLQQFFRDKQKTKCELLKNLLYENDNLMIFFFLHVKALVQGNQSFARCQLAQC